MLLEQLLTEMTDEQLAEHLRKLRKTHATGAQTKVRTIGRSGEVKPANIGKVLKNLTPEKMKQLIELLEGKT